MRERRVEQSVALFDRRMSALQRSSAVRDVFGSYDPYRDMPGRRSLRFQEQDHSYPPVVDGYDLDGGYLDDLDDPDDRYDDVDLDEPDAPDGPADARPRESPASGRLARVQNLPAPATRRTPAGAGTPRAAAGAGSRHALRRRRQIFFTLFLLFATTLGAAVVVRTPAALGVHVVAIAAFLGYVNLLVRHHQRMVEQTTKVRRLVSEPGESRPTVVVLSSGGER